MKKYISLLALVILLLLICASCSISNNDDKTNSSDDSLNNKNSSYQGDYDAVGVLVAERTNEIDIKNGKSIKTYKTLDDMSNYYVGEYIGVIKKGDYYEVKPYKEYNFDKRYTVEGQRIYRINGKIDEITENEIIVALDDGTIIIKNPGNFDLSKGTNAIIDYITTDNGNELVMCYDKANVMVLYVDKISKDYDGKMILSAKNALDMEYIIPVESDVLLNFRHSTLKIGDKINVYFSYANDDNPPKVYATMILK